ncbi:MAG: dihydrodipicolinate synthase family protein [Proteobacteria bacterium]|uniref:dihydrodipicolinate synthase family protein n=1 Tax=Rudaea sp. TaxID=2136325 RepID=UPI003784AF4D|nr:dihydrodipicolinate synthase family protein [Pseudomonadota bacterium]
MSQFKISGLCVASHSPFHPDGSLAPEVVARQARFYAKNGIRYVFMTGSTGEAHSLSLSEKLAIYDAWAAAKKETGLTVIAHVGDNCIEDAKVLAAHAQQLGLDAISAVAPSYFKLTSLDVLVDVCAAIAGAAPALPFYYYDIPPLTGINLANEKFLVEAPARIPNLVGIKFTNPDLVAYRRSLDVAGDKFDLPWGVDEMLLAGLATGAHGGVGSTYNWAPKLYTDLIAAFTRGDLAEARRLQSTSIAMIDAIAASGFLGTAKGLMAHLGVPVGPARLPLPNPTPAQFDALLGKLDALGFAQWGAKAL